MSFSSTALSDWAHLCSAWPILASRFMSCSLWVICLGVVAPTLSAQESRREFFDKLQRIEENMTMDQVETILGKPDDVWTKSDKVVHNPQVQVVWGYGNEVHLQLPTLGQVQFNSRERVHCVVGKSGSPIAPDVVEEVRLRELLQLLARGPRLRGEGFNPYELIALANVFQPLGQEKAFAVFREYVRVSHEAAEGQEPIRLLLLCLHDIPDTPGYLPQAPLGAPFPAAPDNLRLYPRFPLCFIDDVPLLLVKGYELGGETLPVSVELDKYERRISWIEAPLPITKNPRSKLLNALHEFHHSPLWYLYQKNRVPYAFDEVHIKPGPWILDMLESQLERFVASRDEQ